MLKNIGILTILVIFSCVEAHQSNPFQPFQHYLRSHEKYDDLSRVEDAKYRLGDETFPLHYDVKLKFNTTQGPVFTGDVQITFQAKVDGINVVVLNGENIDIKDPNDVKIYQKGNTAVQYFEKFNYNVTYQKFTFTTDKPLNSNIDYIISIKYTGQLKDDLLGVYYSEYKQENVTKTLIATHFGQFARRMMPCWDEPRFKAEFKFTVERDAHLKSRSNAQLERTDGNTDFFKTTTKISTYILALVISDFNVVEKDKFGVLARPNAIGDTEYALVVGPKLIKAFDDWTDMPYHQITGVDKMELGAIPDFFAGAMENWGLILQKESYTLYNKNYANTAQKQLIPTAISHELAHMWFGDLVTCDWFDETYLNEGFARYFQFIGLDKVEPTYNGMMQFPVSSTQKSMQADSNAKSYPLSNKGVLSVPEVGSMFGPISYDKGGSILRMAHHLMGDTKFKNAIRSYLKKRQLKTAITEDLLTELEREYAGISDILAPYIYQPGYPLLTVARAGDILNVTQKRFIIDDKENNDTSKWTVPISIATKTEHFTNTLSNLQLFKQFSNSPFTINITSIKSDYYVFNIQQFAFYRVNYDTENWNAIARALKSDNFGGIHVLNRAQIVDDLFNLARAGYLTYDYVFTIINYMKKETHYLPWLSFFNGLSHLNQRIVNNPLKNQFDAFINDLLGPITDSVSFDVTGDEFIKMNRIQILEWSCKYGNTEACVNKALDLFEKVVKGENIESDLKPAVYCTGLRETYTNWKTMWDRYVASNYATEKDVILKALGCAKNTTDINTLMDKILTKDIRLQDKPTAYVSAVSGNLESVDIVLDYLIKNTAKWGEVMDVVSTLGDLSARFTNAEQFEKFEKHVNTLKEEWKTPLLAVSKENRKLLEWDTARLPELKQFFDNSGVSKSVSFSLIILIAIKYLLF